MKHRYSTCDRCGKKADVRQWKFWKQHGQIRNSFDPHYEIDLCHDCAKSFEEWMGWKKR